MAECRWWARQPIIYDKLNFNLKTSYSDEVGDDINVAF